MGKVQSRSWQASPREVAIPADGRGSGLPGLLAETLGDALVDGLPEGLADGSAEGLAEGLADGAAERQEKRCALVPFAAPGPHYLTQFYR